MQALQQSTLNSIKIFDGSNKGKFTTWTQSVENAARLHHLDTLSIVLLKLQGALLKVASYLETEEVNSGKTLVWSTFKKHLTAIIQKFHMTLMPLMLMTVYNRTMMNPQKPIYIEHKTYLSVYIIQMICLLLQQGTNHAKILTGLKDSRVCNKLAKSKAKRWINMAQVL